MANHQPMPSHVAQMNSRQGVDSNKPRGGWVTGFDTQGNLQRVGVERHTRYRNRTVWAHSLVLFNVYGPVLGTALGAIFTISTLVLSSHYKNNFPLVSMQSGFIGLTGAVVHTIIAWQCFRRQEEGHKPFAHATSAGITVITLIIAYTLMTKLEPDETRPWTKKYQIAMQLPKSWRQILNENGTRWFIPGYMLIFYGLFTWPTYLILIQSSSTSHSWPDDGAYALLATLGAAALSATIVAQPHFRRRLGPVNTFILATVFAGVSSIPHVWMPNFWMQIGCAAAYGVLLGAILTLHNKVTATFHWGDESWHVDMPARAAVMMALGGMSAAAGLMVTAFILEYFERGEKMALMISAGALVLGGLLVGVARWRRCRRFYVAI
ncbi:hypothetical protein P153DRAFT_375269 [Dothidotthia symphoricarpi CBS 119687]|uniref:MFS general substrate transporter n=1 Tax=Dothidotthia symphoricarpi CBS 119687 TaxID=1392245 RepID=A0A6A6AF69_9PLEO|nr:uncharacterized protein P153DRAFT_375269 [Dothidotthia symphoricarpi CBS 119687]KAF2130549.1 hypothetical protein P153DRAFT_375269 [Dothidotthia symphoricarpi CBS 119687]